MSRMNWSRPPARRCWQNSLKVLGRCKIWLPKKPVSVSARAKTKRGRMFCARCWEGDQSPKSGSPKSKAADTREWETDRIAVLETNLDDINAEILGHFVETAMAAGALDVFYTPIQMKKNRPGVLLTVLCAEPDADKFSEMILQETSAFGVRRTLAERRKLRREFAKVKTAFWQNYGKIGQI